MFYMIFILLVFYFVNYNNFFFFYIVFNSEHCEIDRFELRIRFYEMNDKIKIVFFYIKIVSFSLLLHGTNYLIKLRSTPNIPPYSNFKQFTNQYHDWQVNSLKLKKKKSFGVYEKITSLYLTKIIKEPYIPWNNLDAKKKAMSFICTPHHIWNFCKKNIEFCLLFLFYKHKRNKFIMVRCKKKKKRNWDNKRPNPCHQITVFIHLLYIIYVCACVIAVLQMAWTMFRTESPRPYAIPIGKYLLECFIYWIREKK